MADGAPAGRSGPCEDVRCGCGSPLARVADGTLELDCRRCKRVRHVAPGGAGRAWRVAAPR